MIYHMYDLKSVEVPGSNPGGPTKEINRASGGKFTSWIGSYKDELCNSKTFEIEESQ